MNVPAQLNGAKVIRFVENDANRIITKMVYEEEDGSSKEVLITGLALAKYENPMNIISSYVIPIGKSIKILIWNQVKKQLTVLLQLFI